MDLKTSGMNLLQTGARRIADFDVYEFALRCLGDAPAYFWEIPASSSGKYHPPFARGPGGLVRHTRAAMVWAPHLARTFNLLQGELDLAVAALALHDTCKYGPDKYDVSLFGSHHLFPRVKYQQHQDLIGAGRYDIIMTAIARHNGCLARGAWVNPPCKPETPLEQLVHLADYLASFKDVVRMAQVLEEHRRVSQEPVAI